MSKWDKNEFRDFKTYKIDPLSEIRGAGIVTNGEIYWVSSVSDADHAERTGLLGNYYVPITVQAAIDKVATDQNDYVLVLPTDGGTVRDLGTAIDVNEDRVHLLGVGAKPAPQGYSGLTFRGYIEANGVDTELINVTGAGVELGGLKFLGTSGTADLGTLTSMMRVGTAASGTPHDLWVHDFHIEGDNAAALGAGISPSVDFVGNVGGGIRGVRFDRCWLGNWNWAPAAVVDMGGGTEGPSRTEFHDCTFVIDAQATTDDFVVMGTGVSEYTIFKNCDFINVEAGTAPASAITGALLVDNPVLVLNCNALTVTAMGTDTEAFVSPNELGSTAGFANPLIAKLGTAASAV